MPTVPAARKGIRDAFYETRVLMGRDYTLRRFATEVLGGTVDPVMLGYIEKGKRFPTEGLVRRLAAVRKEDAHGLLALLWRDRILHAFGRELKRVLQAPRAVSGIDDAELAVLVSQAIAALPDDGSPISTAAWRKAFRRVPGRRAERVTVSDEAAARVEKTLVERGLVEVRSGKARRRGRHFVPQGTEEKQSLALEFCALCTKGLLDKLALAEEDTGTYLRNHFLNIEPEQLVEFHRRLDEAVRRLAEEFAADPSTRTRLLNVLVTATPF
jgi:hypothetical protein